MGVLDGLVSSSFGEPGMVSFGRPRRLSARWADLAAYEAEAAGGGDGLVA
jgi:hypothetical protein